MIDHPTSSDTPTNPSIFFSQALKHAMKATAIISILLALAVAAPTPKAGPITDNTNGIATIHERNPGPNVKAPSLLVKRQCYYI
jgi:hypothetical protein